MRFQNVNEKLKSYAKTKFSGAAKIGIEMGKCVSFGVSNDFDVPKNKIEAHFLPEEFLSSIGNDFFGTIIYFYENGEITYYSYCQSFKGESLNKFLGER